MWVRTFDEKLYAKAKDIQAKSADCYLQTEEVVYKGKTKHNLKDLLTVEEWEEKTK